MGHMGRHDHGLCTHSLIFLSYYTCDKDIPSVSHTAVVKGLK
jgi:hypothetical protein